MRTLFALVLALGAAPASARVLAALPRVAAPAALPFGAPARPALGTCALAPSLDLAAPGPAPALLPAAAGAPEAKSFLENAAAALDAPGADQAAASRRAFDATRLSVPSDAPAASPPGPGLRAPDGGENARVADAVALLSRTPVGRDVYAKAYKDHGSRLQVLVDDAPGAGYDARLHWRDGAPALALTRETLSRASGAALAAFLVRELSHLYYRDFPDSAERSWMAHSVMVRAFAEITGSGPRWWDQSNDLARGGRHVMRSFFASWAYDLDKHDEPRRGKFFAWLKTSSDSRSGPNAGLSLREQHERGTLSWDAYRRLDRYFGALVGSERRWLDARR